MPDMLVKLYELPALSAALDPLVAAGISVRRALAPERSAVGAWVEQRFPAWSAEVDVCFTRLPTTCFIAVRDQDLLGFACIESIARGFFGPTAVADGERGRGVGRALLLAALHGLRAAGYAYGIIGGVGPAEFYAKLVGATPIEGSTPGIYAGLLKRP